MAQVNTRNRKRADGSNNWEYRFEIAKQDGKRKRVSKSGFATKKEAYEEGMKAFNEYNSAGVFLKPSEVSFSDFLDMYLEKYCAYELAANTAEGYAKKIRLYIKPFLGAYKLSAINPVIITDLFRDLKSRGYSKNTLIGVKTVLMSAFNYAVNPLQLIKSSPMPYVKLPKESKNQKEQSPAGGIRIDGKKNGAVKGSNPHIYIPKEKMDEIFKRFPKGHVDHIPLMTGYCLGLRIAETYALLAEDFDFKNMTVSISRQVQWNSSKKVWYFKDCKFDSMRTISIPPDYARLIKDSILRSKKARLFYGEYYTRYYLNSNDEINTDGDGEEIHLLNIRENGSYVSSRTMQHCSQIIHHKMGFKEFDYHSLRHTHATDLAKSGANPKYVQHRLGHKTIKVTIEIYQHLDVEFERQQSEVLQELYG